MRLIDRLNPRARRRSLVSAPDRSRAVTTVVSLGGHCQVAWQIEHRFGFRINSPFDWLVTPLTAIGEILADDGARLGQRVRVMFDGEAAICGHYGVAYQHEFPRDAERRVLISEADLAKCRAKFAHKYDAFVRRLSTSSEVLFVRLGGHLDEAFVSPYRADPRPLTTEDLNGLCAVLAKRFPHLSFRLAMVTLPKFTKLAVDPARLDPRVHLFEIADDPGPKWAGKIASWAQIFDAFTFALEGGEDQAKQFVGSLRAEELHA
jgi:hypothetical protein